MHFLYGPDLYINLTLAIPSFVVVNMEKAFYAERGRCFN